MSKKETHYVVALETLPYGLGECNPVHVNASTREEAVQIAVQEWASITGYEVDEFVGYTVGVTPYSNVSFFAVDSVRTVQVKAVKR